MLNFKGISKNHSSPDDISELDFTCNGMVETGSLICSCAISIGELVALRGLNQATVVS